MNNRNIVIICLLVILIILIFCNFQEKYSNHNAKVYNIDKMVEIQRSTSTGAAGEAGKSGEQGAQGMKGERGPQGPKGPQGHKGPKGDSLNFKSMVEKDSKIGIGTKEPKHKLHVEGNIMVNGNFDSTGMIKSAKLETGDMTTKNISTEGTITTTDKITTKELESREVLKGQKLCIDDVCLDKEGLKKIVDGKFKSHFRKGMIVAWQGITPPPGWKLCDGKNGTPDLRGRFVLGSGKPNNKNNGAWDGGSSALYPSNYIFRLNQTSGTNRHKLTTNELPSHKHKDIYTNFNKKIQNDDLNNSGGPAQSSFARGGHDNGYLITGPAGGDKPHNNMPPYYVLAYIMKK